MPMLPRARGRRVEAETQANWTPAQERPMRKEVREAMKRVPPSQSTWSSLACIEVWVLVWRRM